MAVSTAGTALTSAHRLDQIRLRTATARDLLRLWATFDINDISGSWARLEPALVALIQARQPLSARLSAQYLTDFRRAEQVAGSATIATAPPLATADIVPNLRFVGPANALRLFNLNRVDASKVTFTNVEGEMTRQILNGGRKTIVDTVHNDSRARGYIRVTDGAPCAFCAMLAGRGPVYRSQDTGGFDAHRKCGCTAEPVYRDDQPWPASAQQFADRYREAAAAVPKNAPDWSEAVRREFRRLHDAA